MTTGTFERIYTVVSRIPRGRVATYGQVALLANLPGRARLVGYALNALPGRRPVPWHRVINAQGRISARRGDEHWRVIQRLRLEREKVVFNPGGAIPLGRFRWRPSARQALIAESDRIRGRDHAGSHRPGEAGAGRDARRLKPPPERSRP